MTLARFWYGNATVVEQDEHGTLWCAVRTIWGDGRYGLAVDGAVLNAAGAPLNEDGARTGAIACLVRDAGLVSAAAA